MNSLVPPHTRSKVGCAATGLLAAVLLGAPRAAAAQDNYEIQVYGSETVLTAHTMFELHSNFTFEGQRAPADGTFPDDHAEHETLEITHGFNSWFETGFYLFTSARAGQGVQWVGDHIRPRFRVPESWHWPVGVSLSQEIGYQRSQFTPATWSYELRPIVDKKIGRWYASVNPTLERALRGKGVDERFEFSPNVALSYDLTKRVNLAGEYYGAMGPLGAIDPLKEQEHQVFGAVNLDLGPNWEFNFGYGVGLTGATDHTVVKMILGRLVP